MLITLSTIDRLRLGRQSNWRTTNRSDRWVLLLALLGTAWKGIASLTGLSVAEPGFEAEAEEQWDNAGGVSGNISPSPSEVRGSASETILSFIACLRPARLFAGLFKTSIWISPSDGDKRPSTA